MEEGVLVLAESVGAALGLLRYSHVLMNDQKLPRHGVKKKAENQRAEYD
jgi:hypothetical protein